MKTVITLKESNNYELTSEGTVINKKSGKAMTETNGTVTLSTENGRKRFKVADLIANNQPKKKPAKKTSKPKKAVVKADAKTGKDTPKTEKKARLKVGDTKIGKDGIERIYSKTPSGFDWRRVKKTKKSNDTKKK